MTANWTSRKLRLTVFPATISKPDMYLHSFTSAQPLSLEEEMYAVFRKYGLIDDLVINGDATSLTMAGATGGGAWVSLLTGGCCPVSRVVTWQRVGESGRVLPRMCRRDPCWTCLTLLPSFLPPLHPSTHAAGSVQFRSQYAAMTAILCLRGTQLPGGRVLHVDYIPFFATRTLKKFVTDHTRIAVILLALVLAALSYAILDPMRAFFIKVCVPVIAVSGGSQPGLAPTDEMLVSCCVPSSVRVTAVPHHAPLLGSRRRVW